MPAQVMEWAVQVMEWAVQVMEWALKNCGGGAHLIEPHDQIFDDRKGSWHTLMHILWHT